MVFFHWSPADVEHKYKSVHRGRAKIYKILFVESSLKVIDELSVKGTNELYIDVLKLLYKNFLQQESNGGNLQQTHPLPTFLSSLILPDYSYNPFSENDVTGFVLHLQQYPHRMNAEA